MMSSQSMHTVVDPLFRSKMPLFDGTIAPTGLSKPPNMSGLLGKQILQYGGAYFTYDPRGKDGAGFTPPWSNSKPSLLDGRSPVSHLSGMEGQNHIIYRQDSNSSEEGHSHPFSLHHAPAQGFKLYSKSPGISSPTATGSVVVRKPKSGGENSSLPSENSVYLAIPKPLYVHNPCCDELGCVIGHRYGVEHGSQRIPNTVYKHDWMQTDAHYTERPPIQRTGQDALLQQRGLQFEPSAEQLKRVTLETYSPGRARTFPAMIDPNYSSYPCSPTRTLFGSLSEQSQRLQTSPRGYASLYPSHPTYEHMTSEVYQEHSPMSKYGQLTQHPMFYYSQANVEVESRTQCKQREDVPGILKHTISNPREHYILPQSIHGEMPLPSPEMLPNHALMRGFDYPCYAVPRFHLNASQIRAPLKMQHESHSLHSNRINVSPSSQNMEHLMASATNLHKDKPTASLHVDAGSHTNSPFRRVDQSSPTRRVSQSDVSPSSIQMNRFLHPLTIGRPAFSPTGLNMDRILDYSSCEAQVTCQKQPKSLPVSPAAWLPRSPRHSSDQIHTAVPNSANVRKIIYSPAVAPGNQHNDPVSSSGTAARKKFLKRSISPSYSPIKIKDEDLCGVELVAKRQRVEMENVEVGIKTYSPPMPVIDNVFSLAPYQAYLQASGVLFPGRVPLRTIHSPEHHEVKTKPDIKVKRPEQVEQQPVVCLVYKKRCADTPTEKPEGETFEPKTIKVEKVDPSDTEDSVKTPVSQRDCNKITIKKEPEETGSPNIGPMLLIKKCEPDELESKPLEDESQTSHESKPDEVTAQINSSSQGDVCMQPKPISEIKKDFKNIPLQCLKLSTYNIILHDTKHSRTARPPKQELQVPVRKHFFELHHSFCKLISNCVLASSERELRTWLSRLELTDTTSPSTKVQKVSCLLGVKAREVCLNEAMKSALRHVLERLREYTAQEHCPFPHVMRTGAVFLPMLVVKQLLFPTVQGSFIDQVLQEHRVELRPTTLSEEKILIQLHKQACSSRLRRLMSLKHLPDIYADVVNLLYYACVCKHLESTSPDVQKRVQD
ncbi:uncharacterized protein C15orf39 homolog [Cottoperca gobio]|uniref:Uncharacterized protein C15orf39 homolog n=1 Tax=Cottoperca gobio TaxID=56716 RepID=A0A6J2PXU3_COTGO|nr:uncharacterized protein C15orf39 homolog [Cottoperca gobio]